MFKTEPVDQIFYFDEMMFSEKQKYFVHNFRVYTEH